MCGIGGALWRGRTSDAEMAQSMKAVVDPLQHRGPDSHGIWCDEQSGIGFAHARLSIIDLSPAGHQPMHSASQRYVITFNGEIYNHLELRAQLAREGKPPNWRGHSDTETLLAACDAWGIEQTAIKTVGMFAFAVWDQREQTLSLVRDRFGEKPLYYGWQGDTFLFASELPSLKAHPAFHAEIDRNALALYMRHNCIPAPWSIYRGIQKQVPGTIVQVSRAKREPTVTTYWSVQQVIDAAMANPFRGSADEAVTELEALLSDAVSGQMMSDVPLGAFLSGGVDSSTIVALMQRHSERPVNTFTIGFDDAQYDESAHARAVARHLGTHHEELIVSPEHARDVIPRLPAMYGEPFADSSQIPTFLVSQLARRHVTVSLSGDGGDELFAGYNRYMLTHKLWKSASQVPRPLRTMTASMITSVSEQRWNSMLGPFQRVLPRGIAQANLGTKLHKSAGVITASSTRDLYRLLISHWTHPNDVVIGAHEPETWSSKSRALSNIADGVHEMMALDQLTYLPDDILTKVDRAAMAVSLETRVPLLDHRVAAFAWSLPLNYLLRDGLSKWPLRQVLYKHVPKALIERPKAGFSIPIGAWLRGPLRDWAENLLDESRLINEGFFHPAPIRTKWREHLSGRRNHEHLLWDVLMFQAWHAEQQ